MLGIYLTVRLFSVCVGTKGPVIIYRLGGGGGGGGGGVLG